MNLELVKRSESPINTGWYYVTTDDGLAGGILPLMLYYNKEESRWECPKETRFTHYIREAKQSPLPDVEQKAIDYAHKIVNKESSSYTYTGEQVYKMLLEAVAAGASLSAGDGWVKELPEIKEECFIITVIFAGDKKYVHLWELKCVDLPSGKDIVLYDQNGKQWGLQSDLTADYYKIITLPIPKAKEE